MFEEKSNKNRLKAVVNTGVFSSITLIISLFESLLPPPIPYVPFIKFGLANIIIIVSLFFLKPWQTLLISIIKATLIPLFIGNPIIIFYSLPANIIATFTTILLITNLKYAVYLASCFSSLIHNSIQIIVACLMLSSFKLFSFFPYIIIFSIMTGLTTGITANVIIKKFPFKKM